MSDFLWFIPGEEDLERALAFPAGSALRLATNAEAAGVAFAGDYAGVALLLWMSSGQVRCILLNRGLSIGWHADPVGDGQPSLTVGVKNGSDAYFGRFLVDLRSDVGTRQWRRLEVLYLKGQGFMCAVDGVILESAVTEGTDNGIAADSGPLSLGGALEGSVIGDGGGSGVAGHQPIGGDARWDDAGEPGQPTDTLTGGIGWLMIQRSPGVPGEDGVWVAFGDQLLDDVAGSVLNDETNGFAWLGEGDPAYTTTEDLTMTAFFKDGAGTQPVDDPTIVSGTVGDDDYTLTMTFKNTSGGTVNSFSLVQGEHATIAWVETPPLSLANNGTAQLLVTVPFETALSEVADSVGLNTSGGNAELNLQLNISEPPEPEPEARAPGESVTVISQPFPATRTL